MDVPDNPEKAARILRKKIGEVAAEAHRETRRITFEDLREAYLMGTALTAGSLHGSTSRTIPISTKSRA